MLDPNLLLNAYAQGVFPMAINQRGRIAWFSPDPRAIIPLDNRFHIPHGLKRALKKHTFRITLDTAFERVIGECAKREDNDTWISPGIKASYINLHRLGYAHSVEVWHNEQLAGGLYGVHLGGAFFGESMFHRVTDASKIALVRLVEHLRRQGFILLDTQWNTPHLAQFGTREIPRNEYLKLLRTAIRLNCRFATADDRDNVSGDCSRPSIGTITTPG